MAIHVHLQTLLHFVVCKYAVSHVPHEHLPVPMTALNDEGKCFVAQGAVYVHTFVSVVAFVGGAYHITKYKYIMYKYRTSLSSGFLYSMPFKSISLC